MSCFSDQLPVLLYVVTPRRVLRFAGHDVLCSPASAERHEHPNTRFGATGIDTASNLGYPVLKPHHLPVLQGV